jgi:hypothetical protein
VDFNIFVNYQIASCSWDGTVVVFGVWKKKKPNSNKSFNSLGFFLILVLFGVNQERSIFRRSTSILFSLFSKAWMVRWACSNSARSQILKFLMWMYSE